MQIRAIMTAAVQATRKGVKVVPEIMMPLIALPEEMKRLREMTDRIVEEILKKENLDID